VAAVAGVLVAVLGGQLNWHDQKDTMTFAASLSGLPKLTEIYATSSKDLTYYSQGDLAFALAAASSDRAEIQKYRKLLSLTLQAPAFMADVSRANLYYSMGKIDLLLGDKEMAVRDFRQAINQHRSRIAEKSNQDPGVREFLLSNALN
jgi:hypothetical protein